MIWPAKEKMFQKKMHTQREGTLDEKMEMGWYSISKSITTLGVVAWTELKKKRHRGKRPDLSVPPVTFIDCISHKVVVETKKLNQKSTKCYRMSPL